MQRLVNFIPMVTRASKSVFATSAITKTNIVLNVARSTTIAKRNASSFDRKFNLVDTVIQIINNNNSSLYFL